MRVFSAFHYSKWTMKRKLFGYMLFLAALLLFALFSGLFLFERFNSTEKNTYESLDIQMEVFEKDISTHFDYLAAAGIRLSKDITALVGDYLNQNNISFSELNDSLQMISDLQDILIVPLRQKLLQENCSGVFTMLDVTVNSSLEHSEYSRTGLYLQVNGYTASSQNLLLYRGIADIGRKNNIMPHRKWRLEFRTDLIPEYETFRMLADKPLAESYCFTDLCTLPATAEKAVLLVVPIKSPDGDFWGLCGFEISESYFMTYHAQPTKIPHLTCLLSPEDNLLLDASSVLSCGVFGGYYRAPRGTLKISNAGGNLLCFSGDTTSYIGLKRPVILSPNNKQGMLAVLMPKSDYDHEVNHSRLQNLLLISLLLFFTINCCLFLSQKFLSPILNSLEMLKSDQHKEMQSHIPEINDLFAFLAKKDREHEKALSLLVQEKQDVQSEKEQLQSRYETAQAEISRLAYSRKQEIDPDNYQQFLAGINTLTPAERRIFSYYLSGKTVKEILEIASIKESTLRYHNQNIYSKLGVNSLKQLLRYAALMNASES